MPSTVVDPAAFLARVRAAGATVERCAGSILTITKTFTPGSNEGYTDAESACSLVNDAPGSDGSVWGTDGGSIGGAVALRTGVCTMNKSGVQKRWLAKLSKLLVPAAAVPSEPRESKPAIHPLPMVRYEVHSERDADGAQMIDLHIAHISCTAYVFWDHIPEAKRDLDRVKDTVAAAAKLAAILRNVRPQCAGDEYVTIEVKRTQLYEIENLLKVER